MRDFKTWLDGIGDVDGAVRGAPVPGKRTLTSGLPGRGTAAAGSLASSAGEGAPASASPADRVDDPFAVHLPGAPSSPAPRVQCKADGAAAAPDEAVARAGFSGTGAPLPAASQIEPHLGADLAGVQAYFGPAATAACDALGAEAYTLGHEIAFRDNAPSLALQAHEATHVVQQGAARATGPQAFGSGGADQQEREADRIAEAVAGPGSLPTRADTPSGGGAVQRFAPAGHRDATVEGLSGSFGVEEIGEIYAANWERDFAQGPVEIADLVLSWKQCKVTLGKGAESKEFVAAAADFRTRVDAALGMDPDEAAKHESLGGSQPWHHVDNEGAKDAEKRWRGKKQPGETLPGYLLDGRAYIKDELGKAVTAYRDHEKLASVGKVDNWNGAATPAGYGTPEDRTPAPASRHQVAADATAQAEAHQAASGQRMSRRRALRGSKASFAAAADGLGRATHALEDFFAHSNWLELAKEMKRRSGPDDAKPPGQLRTGTFELDDKIHAVGHKLVAVASTLEADFALLLKIYGRSAASTALDAKEHADARKDTTGRLENQAYLLTKDALDVLGAGGAAAKALAGSGGKLVVADLVTNRSWLAALRAKGDRLIARAGAGAPATTHRGIAKDQPEPGKDYEGARRLAIEANRLVIAPLATVMDMADGEAARDALTTQLAVLDIVMTAPTKDHPLMPFVRPSER